MSDTLGKKKSLPSVRSKALGKRKKHGREKITRQTDHNMVPKNYFAECNESQILLSVNALALRKRLVIAKYRMGGTWRSILNCRVSDGGIWQSILLCQVSFRLALSKTPVNGSVAGRLILFCRIFLRKNFTKCPKNGTWQSRLRRHFFRHVNFIECRTLQSVDIR